MNEKASADNAPNGTDEPLHPAELPGVWRRFYEEIKKAIQSEQTE